MGWERTLRVAMNEQRPAIIDRNKISTVLVVCDFELEQQLATFDRMVSITTKSTWNPIITRTNQLAHHKWSA